MYSLEDAKVRAKKVRAILKDLGRDVTHANAIEFIARRSIGCMM